MTKIYEMKKIRVEGVNKYMIFMDKKTLENILDFYKQKFEEDRYNYITIINNKKICIFYEEMDKDWGMYMVSNNKNEELFLKTLYYIQNMFT
tara:strand:+ start:241 stop:516 length:276 start_codon:yes stop_codon:yes gene_type:complete